MLVNDYVDLVSISENNNEFSAKELCLNADLNHSCKYYDLLDFNELIKDQTEKFSVLSLNIRSLSNKFQEFKEFITDLSTNSFNFSAISLHTRNMD